MIEHIISQFFELHDIIVASDLKKDNLSLKSYICNSKRCKKIRFCKFEVDSKFYAESLVIYPNLHFETPIFGTEYIKIGSKRYFGAIDFHPITDNKRYLKFLDIFPDKKEIKTNVYDLNQFFSKKLWIRRKKEDFYNEYQIMLKCFLHQYKKCLYAEEKSTITFEQQQNEYNCYMKTNDPAYGILKSYFNKDFAEEYIDNFLFSNKYS